MLKNYVKAQYGQVSCGSGTPSVYIPVADDHKLLHSRTPVASEDIVVQSLATVRHEECRVANYPPPRMLIHLDNFQLQLLRDDSVTL